MRLFRLLTYAALTIMVSCTTVHVQRPPSALNHNGMWALLPMVNYTQTPQAGLRAEAILETLVRARGVGNLQKYPSELNSESLFEPAERAAVDRGMKWARNLEADYALTGTVEEWRYKVGVDGEPAVGMTLQLIELRTGRVLWTAVGSKTGWSREALSAVAQKLLVRLTQPLAAGSKPKSKPKAEARTTVRARTPAASPRAPAVVRARPSAVKRPSSPVSASPKVKQAVSLPKSSSQPPPVKALSGPVKSKAKPSKSVSPVKAAGLPAPQYKGKDVKPSSPAAAKRGRTKLRFPFRDRPTSKSGV